MKRLRLWMNEFSLTQQLLGIVFLFVSVFAGFVFFFLNPAINQFSQMEMFELLHNSQNTMIVYMNENPDHRIDTVQDNSSISVYLYNPETDSITHAAGEAINDDLKEDIRRNGDRKLEGTQDYTLVTTVTQDDVTRNVTSLYSMTLLKDGRYLVSILSDSYQERFQRSLINGIVLMNGCMIGLLFAFLLVWVGSLIFSLNQIRNYITKIRNDEPAVLQVKRNDEIGEVATALTVMESELARQNHEKEEMIQNISHDLKTPIATIKSYSEAIKDGIYPYDTLEKSVDVIIEHAERLEKKVKSLILLNKMGYLQDTAPEGNNLDMNEVIEKAILSLKVVRPEIELISKADEVVFFHGDEEPWRITVENLIDNALRYARSQIVVELHPDELCIINDGSHIEEDRMETLFHPYEKGTDGQFGLGLSIVYRVCTTYGYHVQAENLKDGVCFRIWKERRNKESRRKDKNVKRA
ncbi:MAG: histidine kinase dimerization/phospho-acceptor domain-containing protein [Bulleidia sp.]